jgi:hypothetical protein
VTAFGRSFALHEIAYCAGMNWLLITAALACNPGDRLVDLRDKIPRGQKFDRPDGHCRTLLCPLLQIAVRISGD